MGGRWAVGWAEGWRFVVGGRRAVGGWWSTVGGWRAVGRLASGLLVGRWLALVADGPGQPGGRRTTLRGVWGAKPPKYVNCKIQCSQKVGQKKWSHNLCQSTLHVKLPYTFELSKVCQSSLRERKQNRNSQIFKNNFPSPNGNEYSVPIDQSMVEPSK